MGCATLDEVHPLQSALQAFQSVRGLKSIVVYPDLEHGWRADFLGHGKGLAGSLPSLTVDLVLTLRRKRIDRGGEAEGRRTSGTFEKRDGRARL